MLKNADRQAPDQVDQCNHNPGNRVAANKLSRSVHRGMKISVVRKFFTSNACLLGSDVSCSEIGINGKLLAWKTVQGESSGHFTDSCRTFCHDNELNHYHNCEQYQSNQ